MESAFPVQICTGTVMHKRLRPAVNAFRYGVFFLRLQLRALEQQPESCFRWFSVNRFNLLAFHMKDHADGKGRLSAWADQILHANGIHDADGEITLQCFPRVLGYVFNPVSFWFCHRADGALRAVICEVNNTFGEKHIYLLAGEQPLGNGVQLQARKIFHVSPFCETTGQYRFRFIRREQDARVAARIEYDDVAGPLITTSVSGQEHAMSDRRILQVFARYPLMTLAVVWRIHWQALRLWIKRVPFFTKPLPPSQEVSR